MRYVNSTSVNPYVSVSAAELCRLSGLSGRNIPLPGDLRPAVVRSLGNAEADVSMNLRFEYEGMDYEIRGTADAVCAGSGTVYEFASAGAARIPSPARAHSPQTLILACIYASNENLSSVTVCTLYADPDGIGEPVPVSKVYRSDDLSARLSALMPAARRRAERERQRTVELIPSLSRLPFPFPSFREGQRELIETVWSAVRQGERLFAQAPTGTGKTVSVLYGALRAVPSADIRRIFFLTAKASTRREAFAAARKLTEAGAPLRTVILTAKEQICPFASRVSDGPSAGNWICDPDRCPLMSGYSGSASDAISSLLSSHSGFTSGVVSETASAFRICPYELSLDLSEYCDIIICDYNYVFDPSVRLRRYFSPDADSGNSVLLIDEAHNLPDRARDIFSASMSPSDLARMREYSLPDSPLRNSIDALEDALNSAASLCSDNSVKHDDGSVSGWYFSPGQLPDIDLCIDRLCANTEKFYFTRRDDRPAAAEASALLRTCRKWQDAASCYGREYRTYISVDRDRVCAQLRCLDPASRLDSALNSVSSSVFFSATLTPADYFADVLGGGRNYMSLDLPSPFPRENLFVCAVTDIDTRYDKRDKSVGRLVYVIAAAAKARPGNYIAFFPSYAYMEPVADAFRKKYPNVKTAVQKRAMSRSDREAFLDFFTDDSGVLRIGFCVLGGSFSEGIDLPGSRLIGVVIAGVGLPGLSAERNMISEYYDSGSCAERGYDYAYTYPGMNSVLQAAGRVIRRETDRGVVILCDDRYATPLYRSLMPGHWDGIHITGDITSLPASLRDFWARAADETVKM